LTTALELEKFKEKKEKEFLTFLCQCYKRGKNKKMFKFYEILNFEDKDFLDNFEWYLVQEESIRW